MDAEKRQIILLSEEDLALVHALQVSPRAPWSLIGRALGADAGTAARRWARLEGDRSAWFVARASATALSPTTDAALARVGTRPGGALPVAEMIATDESVVAVDLVAGGPEVVALVVGCDIADVRRRVTSLVADRAEVTVFDISFLTVVHREDAQWRLRALPAGGQRMLREPAGGGGRPLTAERVAELVRALGHEARLSFTALADRLGTSEATARRLLTRALHTDAIRLGCDVAMGAVGLGRSVVLEVEASDPRRAGAEIAGLPEVVRCAEVVADANLFVLARFSTLTELARFESAARERVGGLRVVRRSVLARAVKRQGRLLDSAGRARAVSSSSSR